ncbi:MAG: ribonuclease H-like YkuK family protein [Limnobacter sp.]|nr:ribonuclease H-like YkuK family protein [Limnobacter sp.]
MSDIRLNEDKLKAFLASCGPGTKVYLGCDSERIIINNTWYADYTLCIVIHINGRHGCKIFGEVHRQRDFDQRADRPSMRLMNEVYKVAELYERIKDVVAPFHPEVHLDISADEMNGSSCVVNQAIGYIIGVCQLTPMIKPRAFAASAAADRFKSLKVA